MHLGRFHAVIETLVTHFEENGIPQLLANCVSQLSAYASNRAEVHLIEFKSNLKSLYDAATIKDERLNQPYAQDVINELNLDNAFLPLLSEIIDEQMRDSAFDVHAISAKFTKLQQEITDKIAQLFNINIAFKRLGVEIQRVHSGESEVGLLIPREIVGNKVHDLVSEFSSIEKLAKAINEMTGADYDPKVVTISSSAWQIFIESGPAQILLWVAAIERITLLYKNGLEIKILQKQLEEKKVPEAITKELENSINTAFSNGLKELAAELRKSHSIIEDDARGNELETQLRQGLNYLSKRVTAGAQVEINMSLPPPQKPLSPEESEKNTELAIEITKARARLEDLREIRSRAMAASAQTINIEHGKIPLFLTESDNPHGQA